MCRNRASASAKFGEPRSRSEGLLWVVPLACVVLGYMTGKWVARGMATYRLRHGLLSAGLATSLYFILIAARPGVGTVVAAYGAPGFIASQSLRIAGCIVGATRGNARR